MSHIRDRRILITGAASGMGRLMAERFDALGARLVLVDVDARVGDLADTLGHAEAHVVDVRDAEAVARLRSSIDPIDVLVNNAGVVSAGPYAQVPLSADERMLDVNVRGVHLMTKAFIPDLVAAREGHLVMMASVAALIGTPYQAVYGATKWFVAGLGESIRQELRVEGHNHVHVTIVCPSVVNTHFYDAPRAPHLVPILQPETVADAVVRAVQKNRRYVRMPLMVKLAPILRGLLPSAATDAIGRTLGIHRVVSPDSQHRGPAA